MRSLPFLLLAGCATTGPTKDIEDGLVRMYTDLSAKNWAAFEAQFIEGAVVIRGASVQPIRDFIEKNRKALEGNTPFEETSEGIEVRIHRDTATAWSRFRGRFGDRTWGGYDVFTLVRKDGRWRIASIAVSTE